MSYILHPIPLIILILILFIRYLIKIAKDPKMVRGNFIADYQFPPSINHKLTEKYPHLNSAQVDEIIDGLRTYFQICNRANDNNENLAMPSQAVDAAWHEFILHTKLYSQFCEPAFGRFLHHSPAEGMVSQTQANLAMRLTYKHACMLFGISRKKPHKLPPIFALDAQLNIPQGFNYSLKCLHQNDGSFCLSDIGCMSDYKADGKGGFVKKRGS
jgi:hypothetical protein